VTREKKNQSKQRRNQEQVYKRTYTKNSKRRKGAKPPETNQALVFEVNVEKLEEIHIPQTPFKAICPNKKKQTQNDKVRS
jgi:hypothetical protein